MIKHITSFFWEKNETWGFAQPVEIEPTPEPNPDATTELSKFSTVEVPDFDSWKQTSLPDKFEPIFHQRTEMRKKRAISKILGKNCGTRPGPKPRHITSSRNDDDPRLGFEKFRHLTRNTIWMKNKDWNNMFL